MSKQATPKKPAPATSATEFEFARLSIKSEQVFVGNVVLTLVEPGIESLIEIANTLLSERLGENVQKIGALFRDAFGAQEPPKEGEPPTAPKTGTQIAAEHIGTIVDVVRNGVIPLLGYDLREIAAILLDRQVNRDRVAKSLGEDGDEYFPVEYDANEVDRSPRFRSWVRRSCTLDQYEFLLEKFAGLRGWAETGKRIAAHLGLGSLTIKISP